MPSEHSHVYSPQYVIDNMQSALSVRLQCRAETITSHTSGLCPGHLQANLAIVPGEIAENFNNLCMRNPVPCPVLARTVLSPKALDAEVVDTSGPNSFDVRTDFPQYLVYENGHLSYETSNCLKEWRDGYVAFLIGCSYSFEGALIEAGLPPKNIVQGHNVAMFKTNKMLDPAGIFVNCPYVVSMRPYKKASLERVREVTRAFQLTHGEPIDWGFDGAARLGIADLQHPDYGDVTEIAEDEIPVFWACGVTPQYAIEKVGHLITGPVITHKPGCMLVLDATYEDLAEQMGS